MDCARNGLSIEEHIIRLAKEYNFFIRKTKLCTLQKHLDIPSVRKTKKTIPEPHVVTVVANTIADDIAQRNGAGTIKELVKERHGLYVARDTVRSIIWDIAPQGPLKRVPGRRPEGIPRGTLTAIGPMHEVHCDGHEKIARQGLQMGEVSLPIYLFRDKASGRILLLECIPDCRHGATVAHLFLDMVEELGATSVQLTFDKGTETGELMATQTALRTNYAKDLDVEAFPPAVALPSTRNIVAENMWRWQIKTIGASLKMIITGHNGVFLPMNRLHINLFHWLWSQIVQHSLVEFRNYWNHHHTRSQPNKALPSGKSPNHIFDNPRMYGLDSCAVVVPADAISAMRDRLDVTRERTRQWVNPVFDMIAHQVYQSLGSPVLTRPRDGWSIFQSMVPLLEEAHAVRPGGIY
ncbi:hypothetical protein FISHEDRAFT_70731 [Fistulina hepatica ATCC 64428]|uniref:Integrase core domain-containing protein n=1 Tax=Fistulina hepatica ATCC 64428 TaxID=1128425 RepID=A0A0D7AJM6_9AGAR|nr:hypothetical protein FISHEDRAFT_70731 [Fistulina hepatica ATCC 64428]